MKEYVLAAILCIVVSAAVSAEIPYPYHDTEGSHDIQAYWYNVPEAKVNMTSGPSLFHSLLQVYGKATGDLTAVTVTAFLENGEKVFEERFNPAANVLDLGSETPFAFRAKKGFFCLERRVDYLEEKPAKIVVTVHSGDQTRSKEIACHYHKISGRLTNFEGNSFKGFVWFGPDAFSTPVGVVTDESGYYEIDLPERTYNTVFACSESYGQTVLEAWGWHVVIDRAETLDWKIGNAEVYGINAWPNNGGGKTYLLVFRPMSLLPREEMAKRSSKISISGREIDVFDIAPKLDCEALTVTVNGKEAQVLSVQRFYEADESIGMPAHIVQVSRKDTDTIGKLTFRIEFVEEMEVAGDTITYKGMGVFQMYANYNGLSVYF